jgi:hypothetical protein
MSTRSSPLALVTSITPVIRITRVIGVLYQANVGYSGILILGPLGSLLTRNGPRQANAPLQTICTTRTVADADTRNPMTDREKILIALREKPLKVFEIMKRVNIKHQDDCQSLLLKMRDDGAVKFDIHKGHWLAA